MLSSIVKKAGVRDRPSYFRSRTDRERDALSGIVQGKKEEPLKKTPLQKEAREKEISGKERAARGAGGAAGLAATKVLGESSAERTLGAKRFAHGTSQSAADSILEKGLDPSFGGSGSAQVNPHYELGSKGKVHIATGPIRSSSSYMHAVLAGIQDAQGHVSPLSLSDPKQRRLGAAHARVLQGAMPYELFEERFETDPDYAGSKHKALRDYLAARSKDPVDPSHFTKGRAGLRTIVENRSKDLGSYIRKHPGRVSRGGLLGLAALGAGAGSYGLLRDAATGTKESAAYKLHGRTEFQGLPISIENRKGSYRYWKDQNGKDKGRTYMNYSYGYIRGTEGTDGDHLDVYLGPQEDSQRVFVVNQVKKPKDSVKGDGKEWRGFDEQKVMLGFPDAAAARAAYKKQYDDPRFFGSMKELSMDEFKSRVAKKSYHGEKIAELRPYQFESAEACGHVLAKVAVDESDRSAGRRAATGGLLGLLGGPVGIITTPGGAYYGAQSAPGSEELKRQRGRGAAVGSLAGNIGGGVAGALGGAGLGALIGALARKKGISGVFRGGARLGVTPGSIAGSIAGTGAGAYYGARGAADRQKESGLKVAATSWDRFSEEQRDRIRKKYPGYSSLAEIQRAGYNPMRMGEETLRKAVKQTPTSKQKRLPYQIGGGTAGGLAGLGGGTLLSKAIRSPKGKAISQGLSAAVGAATGAGLGTQHSNEEVGDKAVGARNKQVRHLRDQMMRRRQMMQRRQMLRRYQQQQSE